MDYTYPAGKGAPSWPMGRPPSMPFPAGGPSPGFMGVPVPYAAPMSGKYGAPAGYPMAKGQYPAYASGQHPAFASPWAGKGGPGPVGWPPAQPAPPRYMSEMLPAVTAYEPGEEPMIFDLAAVIAPAMANLLPAIQGLLQIPALLMEYGEGASLLSRWDDLLVTLTPEPEPAAENPPGETAAENPPGETAAENPPGETAAEGQA